MFRSLSIKSLWKGNFSLNAAPLLQGCLLLQGYTSPPLGAKGLSSGHLHVTVEPLSDPYVGVTVITLNRPEARNAIGRQLLRELQESLSVLRQERSTQCVVVRSAVPGVFCAGADLKERAAMSQVEASEFVTSIRKTMSELEELPMPTIAAIDGFAMGGGMELALACDMRVMGARAVLSAPEVQLGIIPGAGGTQRLPRIVGEAKAKELILLCKRIGATEAAACGLATEDVGEGDVYERAVQLAAQVARGAPLALRCAKAAIHQGMGVDLHTGLRLEEAYYAAVLGSKDRLEGLKAFAEKRPPVYTGE